jgi:putative endonuclease
VRWFARAIYEMLVWRERRFARRVAKFNQNQKSRRSSVPRERDRAAHLKIGRRGEMLAYWYLRQAGYTLVARNRRPGARAGELDLVGWDGPVLAFIEVKTRSSDQAGRPEGAVSAEQRRRIAKSARTQVRRMGRGDVNYRFDIVSVSWEPGAGYCVRLVKDAFRERL